METILSIGLRYSDGTEVIYQFCPSLAEIAASEFLDDLETTNKIFNDKECAKVLVRKSDLRPTRKAEFFALYGSSHIKVRQKYSARPSEMLKNPEAVTRLFREFSERATRAHQRGLKAAEIVRTLELTV